MFRKLHIQFTLFSTLITGLVLAAMSCVCLYIAESGMKDNSYNSFLNNSNACITHLQSQTLLTHQWLLEMQQSYGFHIQIMDNGHALFFEKINPPGRVQKAFETAQEISAQKYGLDLDLINTNSTLTKTAHFTFSSQGDFYYGETALIPKKNGMLSLTLLYSLEELKGQIRRQRLYFLAAAVMGCVLLGIFAWLFTKHILKPVEDSRKRQTEFIAAASHELRTPLAVILSSLSAMRKADRQQALHFLSNMEQEGQRMSRLIEDMLSLANADNHSWSIQKTPVELDTLLLQTYEKYEPLARERHMKMYIRLPQEPLKPYPCDWARITQVLSILIENAFSYVPEKGKITLSLSMDGVHPVLQVEDNGPGIPDDQKEAVFQRFYRMDSAHNRKGHFGLGLCIASEIIFLHKGTIRIVDTPGGGATFRIRL